jgi:hypothetical protein
VLTASTIYTLIKNCCFLSLKPSGSATENWRRKGELGSRLLSDEQLIHPLETFNQFVNTVYVSLDTVSELQKSGDSDGGVGSRKCCAKQRHTNKKQPSYFSKNEQETGISESQPQLFRGDTCACHHKMIQVQVVIASVAGISRRWLMTEIVLRLEIFKRFET